MSLLPYPFQFSNHSFRPQTSHKTGNLFGFSLFLSLVYTMKLKIINKRPNRPQHPSLKGKEGENGKMFSIGATHCPLQEPRREVENKHKNKKTQYSKSPCTPQIAPKARNLQTQEEMPRGCFMICLFSSLEKEWGQMIIMGEYNYKGMILV